MSGRSPRWFRGIKYPKTTATVIVKWATTTSNYGYVTIDGTKYKDVTTVEVPLGTEIAVTVRGASSSASKKCSISLNAETVQNGGGTYTFAATGDATLTFSRHTNYTDDKQYCKCVIVMG